MEVRGNMLYWAKTSPGAIIPTKDRENAGYDIYPCFDEEYRVIPRHSTILVPTGIACAVRDRYYLQVHERGSTGKLGLKVSAGVIDSGFRGEIFVALTNVNNENIYIMKEKMRKEMEKQDSPDILYPYEKAIAQLIVHAVPDMECHEIYYDELKNIPSKRGEGELGSTGK